MSWVEFEHMIAASEGAKTVHALDGSATVTGLLYSYIIFINWTITRCIPAWKKTKRMEVKDKVITVNKI
jgi:hypothetical protein